MNHGTDARHRRIDLGPRLFIAADKIGSAGADFVELLRKPRAVEPQGFRLALQDFVTPQLILMARERSFELAQGRLEPLECLIEFACVHDGSTASEHSRICAHTRFPH